MQTTIQTHEDERYLVTSGSGWVSIAREYLVLYSDPPRWRPDHDAGVSFQTEHVPAFIAAMAPQSDLKKDGNG